MAETTLPSLGEFQHLLLYCMARAHTWQGSRHGQMSHPVVEFLTWPYAQNWSESAQLSGWQRAETQHTGSAHHTLAINCTRWTTVLHCDLDTTMFQLYLVQPVVLQRSSAILVEIAGEIFCKPFHSTEGTNTTDNNFYATGFRRLVERWKRFVNWQGDYVKKWQNCFTVIVYCYLFKRISPGSYWTSLVDENCQHVEHPWQCCPKSFTVYLLLKRYSCHIDCLTWPLPHTRASVNKQYNLVLAKRR